MIDMINEVGIGEHIKGFFWLHAAFVRKDFNILLLSITLGIACGFTYPENPELFVLLGITAVLGASLNNPITVIFLIIELTWAPFLLIAAGITVIIAYIFSGPSAIVPGQKRV